LYVTRNLRRSRWGRAYRAIREAELAAQSCGVRSYWYKVSGFALSAGIVAMAGVLAAQTNLQVTMLEGTGTVGRSFEWLIYLLVGGAGTLAGPIVGAFTFTLGFGLDLGGRSLSDRLGGWEALFDAALVIGVVLVAPAGLVGAARRGGGWAVRRIGGVARRPRRAPAQLPPAPVAVPRARHAADPAGAALLTLGRVIVRFGGLAALDGVDLAIRPGTVHGLIGPNGSGKSTLVNVVSGVTHADEGEVRFRGEPATRLTPHAASRRGIARTFQNLQVWRRMSVLENVMIGLHGGTRTDLARCLVLPAVLRPEERATRERARGLLAFVGLSARERDAAGTLPYADQRRVEIARALATDPDLLVLDEPAAGMNPTEAAELVELVRRIRDVGITVLLIEHRMEVVMGLSDTVTVLDSGQVIAQGPPEVVRDDPEVIAAYLGEEPEEPAPAGVLVRAGGRAEGREGEHEAGDSGPVRTGSEPMLAVRDLAVRYGAVRALRGVALDVYEGEVVTIIGSNGAGKSTSLKAVSGLAELLKTVHGEITFRGERIERRPAHRIARMGLAHVPEGRRVFPESTVEENLLLGGYGRPEPEVRRRLEHIYERFPVLVQRRHQPAGLLSGGEQQMLAIGRGLASGPQFLLLDEPSLGLAPLIAEEVFEIVRTLADDGVTILVVEQMATKALAVADRAYVLETGEIVAHGEASALAEDPHVKEAYLGG
jgi:ABC-type branched-subunit amino acid transport system ATPase component